MEYAVILKSAVQRDTVLKVLREHSVDVGEMRSISDYNHVVLYYNPETKNFMYSHLTHYNYYKSDYTTIPVHQLFSILHIIDRSLTLTEVLHVSVDSKKKFKQFIRSAQRMGYRWNLHPIDTMQLKKSIYKENNDNGLITLYFYGDYTITWTTSSRHFPTTSRKRFEQLLSGVSK